LAQAGGRKEAVVVSGSGSRLLKAARKKITPGFSLGFLMISKNGL
jgi:hypothetical protein